MAATTTTIDFNPLQQPRTGTGIHDLPPEILASAFETLIYTSHSDISLILPLTLVCRAWHSLITHTPRLWGILTLDRYTYANPQALARRIARAKASPLSITATATASHGIRVGVGVGVGINVKNNTKAMAAQAQLKALASLVSNWVELDVSVEFLVSVCELYRNRDRVRESELGSLEPIGCDEPMLGWADMCRSLRSLTLTRGQHGHESPAAFFTHRVGGGEGIHQTDVRLHHFTSVSLPKPWILGFLGAHIRTLRLLRGERAMPYHSRWSHPNLQQCIEIDDMLAILRRVPNATYIELERTVVSSWPRSRTSSPPQVSFSSTPNDKTIHLPHLRELTLRGVLYTPLILATIRAPALRTLCVDHTDGGWDEEPLAPVFVQWSQPGYAMSCLHTLELVNCLGRGDDDVAYLVRWLGGMKALVRLFIVEETQSLRGLEDVDSDEEDGEREEGKTPRNLFKALSSPQRMIPGDSSPAQWLCPSLMILRVDLIDTPIKSLISIARVRSGSVVPSSSSPTSPSTPSPPPPPARLRTIETRLCASASQADIELLTSLVDTAHCICNNCALHLPLDNLTPGISISDPDV